MVAGVFPRLSLEWSFVIAVMVAQSLETGFSAGDAGESTSGGAATQALASRPRTMSFATCMDGAVLPASCDRT